MNLGLKESIPCSRETMNLIGVALQMQPGNNVNIKVAADAGK